MEKEVEQDLKNLTNWLSTNKNCLHFSKSKFVWFKLSRKQADVPLKSKLNGKTLYTTNSGIFLGTKTD